MTEIRDRIDIQAILQTAVAPQATFGTQLALFDSTDIPTDLRRRIVTPSNADTELDSTLIPYKYANVYFGQKRVPSELMIGRWCKAASKTFFKCGSAYEQTLATWTAITTGSLKVTDSAAATDSITGLNFSSCTSLAQVWGVIEAALQAIAVPSITGLDSAECYLDTSGRVVAEMQTTGASAPTIVLGVAASGVDVSVLLDAANGVAVAGIDAESPEAAAAAISAIDDSYYNINIRSESIAQAVSLSTWVNSKRKLLDIFVTDSDAVSSGATTDAGYLIKALGHKKTTCIYTEQTDQYPDAAISGCVFPAAEGSTSFAWEVLSSVSKSGLTNDLTATEKAVLDTKGYNYIETVGSNTYNYNGITAGNEEKRIMLARDWFVARIEEAIFAFQLNTPLAAFDNKTLTALESIIWGVADIAIERGILLNTVTYPFTVTLPNADDITAAMKATHTLTELTAFTGYLNSAINEYQIIGTWNI